LRSRQLRGLAEGELLSSQIENLIALIWRTTELPGAAELARTAAIEGLGQ
jgi:hypothetical protein